jgi:ectoine hydroxylase-related dioxygenase (phytanoyl-CoA dioxygenase family)
MMHHATTFAADGVEIRRAIIHTAQLAEISTEVSLDHEILRRTGIRNLEKKFPSIARVAADPSVLSIAAALLGKPANLVRALFFDKTADRNWSVPWHQDRTVTLNQRVEMPGWGAWTLKDGVHHVQPPRSVLDQMVTIRVHVDDQDRSAGCLSVVPGSHRLGILSHEDIDHTVVHATTMDCMVRAGDALIMHPLILHASSRSRNLGHRRVVHLEYSSFPLPTGVSWA